MKESATYYKSDSTKISFREYWNLTRSWQFVPAAVFKVLHIRLPVNEGIPAPLRFSESLITETEIPEFARNKIKPLVKEFLALGFQQSHFQTVKGRLLPSEIFVASMLHSGGETIARVFYSRIPAAHETIENVFCTLASWLHDGTFLTTTNRKPELSSSSDFIVHRMIGASPLRLREAHFNRLDACRASNPPRLTRSAEDLAQMCEAMEQSAIQFNVSRGVYLEMTPEEIEAAKRRMHQWESAGPPARRSKRIGYYLLNAMVVWFVFNLFCYYALRPQLGQFELAVRFGSLPVSLAGGIAWFFITKDRRKRIGVRI